MQTERFKIAGMTCGGCTSKVTRALQEVSGVGDVNVSLSNSEATVHFDQQLTSPEQLKAAVQGAGYSVNADNTTQNAKGKGCCCR